MTTQTTVNAIEIVKAAGVTTVEEIRLFAMEARTMTKDVLAAGIVELGFELPSNKKAKKIVFADLFARAYEMEIGTEEMMETLSAASETLVAETTTIKEEVNMTTVKRTQEEVKVDAFNKQLPTPSIRTRKDLGIFHAGDSHNNDKPLKDMLAKVEAAKDQYLRNVGENAIVLQEVEFYMTEKEMEAEGYSRAAIRNLVRARKVYREHILHNGNVMRFVGEVLVRLPHNYAQVKVWNPAKPNSKGKLGAPEFVDFADYDLDLVRQQYDMRRPLRAGSGLISLSIVEFLDINTGEVSELSVSLPTEKAKDGTRYDIFQTNDVRFIRTKDAVEVDEPLYVRDNNVNFNAQVTAMVQLYTNEFVQADPRNHHGFNKKSCINMVRFGTKDGVMDDEHMESLKSRVILEQPDVMQLAQVGSEQPNTYCMTLDKWLDLEAVEILNDAEKMEREGAEGHDEDGEVRYQRHDEITIAGKLVKRNTVRESVIEKNCAACPFFCGNNPKTESQVAKEKVQAREAGKADYVSPFYREKAKAKAQHVQTLVVDAEGYEKWVSKFPYEVIGKVEDIRGVRVKSAGMTVYASENVLSMMDPEYVVPTEVFDARHADVMKDINRIFYAAFNFDKLDEAQHKMIEEMEMPDGMTPSEVERWENAMNWYFQAIGWAKDREAAKNTAPFYQHFFQGVVTEKRILMDEKLNGKNVVLVRPANMVELHIEEVMLETKERADAGLLGWGLGYEDLNATEFVRYLDEVAIDYVYDVIINGTEYAIVGGTDKDKELAAGALQEMLEREVRYTFVRGIRREENPLQAVKNLKVSLEMKGYILEVLGLLK